ncbi:hypothetical protein OH77DRAFT_476108 [Trametes cingulata]|nr:hypothetical protein OH77DRAFT_476108 [Trametes cingulata]
MWQSSFLTSRAPSFNCARPVRARLRTSPRCQLALGQFSPPPPPRAPAPAPALRKFSLVHAAAADDGARPAAVCALETGSPIAPSISSLTRTLAMKVLSHSPPPRPRRAIRTRAAGGRCTLPARRARAEALRRACDAGHVVITIATNVAISPRRQLSHPADVSFSPRAARTRVPSANMTLIVFRSSPLVASSGPCFQLTVSASTSSGNAHGRVSRVGSQLLALECDTRRRRHHRSPTPHRVPARRVNRRSQSRRERPGVLLPAA